MIEQFSVCVAIVFRKGTTIYFYQHGHTTHLKWVIGGFQEHLKDAAGQPTCVFPMAQIMNQWNGCTDQVSITEYPIPADLCLTFDFQNECVSGIYRHKDFDMDMLMWMGTALDDLPLIEPWGADDFDKEYEKT